MGTDYLSGKTALVTGAAFRIGRSIALTLAENKVNVIIHSLDEEKEGALETQEGCTQHGVKAWTVSADFSKIKSAEKLFIRLPKAVKKVDFLINSASTFNASTIKDISLPDLEKSLTVNAIAPLLLSRTFAAQTRTGVIINILDTRISGYDLKHTAYQLSKNMLSDLTCMMAREFAPKIRVNGIAPGNILPPPGKGEAYLDKLSGRNLLLRHGTVDDISDTVLFLLQNSFITGEIIFVDGGQNLKEAY